MSVSVLFSFFSFALLLFVPSALLQSLIDLPSGFVFLYAFDVCYFSTEHEAMTVDKIMQCLIGMPSMKVFTSKFPVVAMIVFLC
jgi:hypothetical protein